MAASTPTKFTNPGILWVNSKITKPEAVSTDVFTKWYQTVHIPDIFEKQGPNGEGIKAAYRYKSIDPTAERPYLAVYPVNTLDYLQTKEFKSIPVHSDLFPAPHSCFDFADFDTRYYEHLQTYEPEGRAAGPANIIVSAALTPAPGTDDDFDAWYRQEHCRDVSLCPGHRRTRRYKLNFARQNRKKDGDNQLESPPVFLALHEFDGEELPAELIKTADTPWAKKSMGGVVATEIKIFKLLKGFGDVEAKF